MITRGRVRVRDRLREVTRGINCTYVVNSNEESGLRAEEGLIMRKEREGVGNRTAE